MEVAGIVITFSDVDKYLVAIESADNAQNVVKSLIEFLQKCQRKISKGKEDQSSNVLSQELNYSVRKIVEKLSILGPRPQFILALTEIITFFSALSISWLLELVKSLSEKESHEMASILLLIATTKSGKVVDLLQKHKDAKSLKQIADIAQYFTDIARDGGGLEELAFEGLYQLLDQLDNNGAVFKQYMLPAILPLLDAKRWSSNTIILVLRATDQFKDLDLSASTSKLHNKIVTHPANLELISGVLALRIPKLDNQFWTLILKNVQELSVKDRKDFVAGIWKSISGSLAAKKKDSKLFTLFNTFWSLEEALQAPLLTDALLAVLRRQKHQAGEEVTTIRQKIKEGSIKDPIHIGTVVLCSYPELGTDLPFSVVKTITAKLASNFDDRSQSPLRVSQALGHIARDIENSEFVLEVLKFLFFHGFFVSNSNPSKKPKGKLPVVLESRLQPTPGPDSDDRVKILSGSVRREIQRQFFRVLLHKTTALVSHQQPQKNENDKTAQNHPERDDVLVSKYFFPIIQFHTELVALSDQLELRKPLDEDQQQNLASAWKIIETIHKQLTQKSDNIAEHNRELDAFTLLLCISYAVQLQDPQEPSDTIADLLHCYEDIFTSKKGKQKKEKDENKEKAFSVLVDVLISLQAKPQYVVGTLPEYIIKCIAKYLTAQDVDGILKAITEHSLNKIEDDDEEDSDDDIDMDEGDEDEDEEESEDESEESAKANGKPTLEYDSDESDIMLDDIDEDSLMELDRKIAQIMKKERKPKMKQPPSSKEPDIDFKERVASLLHAYTKKTQTVAVLELLPSLLSGIFELQQQKSSDSKQSVEKAATKEERVEATKRRQRKSKFYITVTTLVADIIKDICHSRSGLVQHLSKTQRDTLFAALSEFCYSQKGKEVNELAGEGLLLLTRDADQLADVLRTADKKASKTTAQYVLRRICERYSNLVLQDTGLLSLIIEHHSQHIQSFISSLEIKELTTVGMSLADMFTKQVKNSTYDTKLLPLLRTIVQKLVSHSNRETLKQQFPTLVFALNSVIQNEAYSENHRKLAKQIAALGFVGSMQAQKKKNKKLEKQAKLANKAEVDKDKTEESDDETTPSPNDKWKKGDLYYTKNKAYQKSRKRKTVTGDNDAEGDDKRKFKSKKKKDDKWFGK